MPFVISLLLVGSVVLVGVVGPDPPLTGLPNPMPPPLATSTPLDSLVLAAESSPDNVRKTVSNC